MAHGWRTLISERGWERKQLQQRVKGQPRMPVLGGSRHQSINQTEEAQIIADKMGQDFNSTASCRTF